MWTRRIGKKLPCRVEANTERILELFDAYQVRGTFFTLGWVAERYPNLIKKIVAMAVTRWQAMAGSTFA